MDQSAMAAPAFLLLLMLALAGAVAAAEAEYDGPEVVVFNLIGFGPVDDKISVGLEIHDVSMGGFTNGRGQWQSFPGHEDLFPSSTPLPFSNSYDDLIGGHANLPDVPLGREAMKQAARVLSAHDPATTTDFGPLKRALASLKVDDIRGPAAAAHSRIRYIEHWDTMSYEVNRANRTGKWDGPFTDMLEKSANIRSMEEALAVVKVLRYPSFEEVLMAHATIINFGVNVAYMLV